MSFNKLEYVKEYQRKYMRYAHTIYGGVLICPKCGKKGYLYYQNRKNLKTGNENKFKAVVHHQHTERILGKKKTIVDNVCYLGMCNYEKTV